MESLSGSDVCMTYSESLDETEMVSALRRKSDSQDEARLPRTGEICGMKHIPSLTSRAWEFTRTVGALARNR
ncbi:hypothetical protein Tco_0502928 [Tanacetum coccineum]